MKQGYPQGEIAGASYEYQQKMETGEMMVVGVNRFASADREKPLPELLRIDHARGSAGSAKSCGSLRSRRSNEAVERAPSWHCSVPRNGEANLMPPLLEAVRSYATLGEICGTLKRGIRHMGRTPVYN